MSRILIVSQDGDVAEGLAANMNGPGTEIVRAESEREGISVSLVAPFDLIIVDLDAVTVAGIERFKVSGGVQEIPILALTDMTRIGQIAQCVRAGADDYLVKPIHPVVLCARVVTLLDRRKRNLRELKRQSKIEREHSRLKIRVEKEKQRTESAELSTIFAMCKLAESRDPETGEHLDRMREYSLIIAEQLMLEGTFGDEIDDAFLQLVYGASPLHDIGKVALPDHILLKPGRLTDDERRVMQTHCELGADTLRAVHQLHPTNAFVEIGIEIAASHHEWWDGHGYPNQLKGDQIPLVARVVAVADVYDALTSARCYKDEYSHQRALDIIFSESGTHFDPRVVNAFFRAEPRVRAVRADMGLFSGVAAGLN
ncbi:MAG: HD domain-containing protein [Chthonomonas sp.]|nr:HD domain-containing protein [Chthonomonas sp.]